MANTVDTVDTVVNSSVSNSVEKTKRPIPKQLKPFTPETSRAMQAKARAARQLRYEMRRRMLDAIASEGLEKYLVKAIKSGDEKLMNIVEKASKLTGVDFGSSEEAVQRVQANVDAKTKSDNTIKFVIEDAKCEK